MGGGKLSSSKKWALGDIGEGVPLEEFLLAI